MRSYAAYGLRSMALRYFNVAGASERNGERHDPETHLIPNLLRAAMSGTPATLFGTDYPTPDGTADPRLHPRDGPGGCAPRGTDAHGVVSARFRGHEPGLRRRVQRATGARGDQRRRGARRSGDLWSSACGRPAGPGRVERACRRAARLDANARHARGDDRFSVAVDVGSRGSGSRRMRPVRPRTRSTRHGGRTTCRGVRSPAGSRFADAGCELAAADGHRRIVDPIVEPLWSGTRILAHFQADPAGGPSRLALFDELGRPVEIEETDVGNALRNSIAADEAVVDGILTDQALRGGEGKAPVLETSRRCCGRPGWTPSAATRT